MFNSDNYSFAGQEYNYDALNSCLAVRLDGSTDEDDIKNASDAINDSLSTRDGIIYCGDIVVGREVSDTEDA